MALFESLSSKLQKISQKMGAKVRITDQDLKEMMREIKLALLEADVNFKLVKELIEDISEKSKGLLVTKSLTPGQEIVKIVHQALIEMLGTAEAKLKVNPSGFTKIMLFGLQGSGKTTSAAKLAKMLKQKGKRPFLVSVDIYRPAAAEQLAILAKQIDVPCYIEPDSKDALAIAKKASEKAEYLMCDTLIIDTAGRSTIDDEMMEELFSLEKLQKADEKLLVVDAMIGQEAVNIALAFEEKIGLDGFIMTKLDGDARGGAALSIHKITGKPIKFLGYGEKIEALETFQPERMASRILGMGDVLSLIEKVSREISEEDLNKTMEGLSKNRFTLDDMLAQFEQVKKLGSVKDLLGMLPGLKPGMVDDSKIDDKIIDRQMAIIRSMTKKERRNVSLLNASRRKRIARGSGTSVQDVNRLVNQYEQAQKMMKGLFGQGKGFGKGFGRGLGHMGGKLSSLMNMFTKK